ncbi:mitochondrial import receptor subunit TOM40 homolog 1-like [Chelonus insularis]|uniref:mitochondrial import receptor subunit TOM40 homolog 1-like n=1 Tax=Chelonus insularis TaxID=460826 RepID=UPI00158D7C97|nr:mitochondrial import receptor subunit TOM40 homolog 1-like [Chelonus insularis]
MGNVNAASAPPPSAMPTLTPPDIPKEHQMGSYTPSDTENKSKNPGTVEELHKLCKDVFPTHFEGAKLMVNKALSNHFQISHTISMSSVIKSGYKFGATFVGTKQTSPTEAYPVLLGDIESSGNLNANIVHQFHPRLKAKMATQVQRSKFTAVQMTSDYRGDTFTASLTVANPDIINGSGVMVAHYLQNVTPALALGGELAYQRGYGIPGGSIAVASLVGRYTNGDSTISASLGPASCHLCFHQRASQQLQIGVELEVNSRMQESTATIAYQIDLPKADIIYRGSIDSNWTVGAVLEKKLQPLPFSFALSGLLNHSKGHFQLGCGLIIG